MDLSASNLMSSLIISTVGFGFFMYGKKAQRLMPLLAGIVLSAFPFFVSNILLMWGIFMAVIGGVYFLRDK